MKPGANAHPITGKLHNVVSGEIFSLGETCVIGRSRESAVVIEDARVSRRHAMIRRQDVGFWYFDLGSVNGSQINGRRVTGSQMLETGDLIQIGDHQFRFEGGPKPAELKAQAPATANTLADVRSHQVLLLVSDIQGFTAISEKLTPDQLAPIIGSWYSQTEAILNRHAANLDKFIGDCVLGYWLDTSPASRLQALKAAHAMRVGADEMQEKYRSVLDPLGLRFGTGAAVHIGPAAYGAISSREFTLLGDAVNLAFRIESLTRPLGRPVLVSADVLDGWPEGRACCSSLGEHQVKGRAQKVEVFALDDNPQFS